MKKQLLLILSLAFTTQHLFAQKESWNWYFGANAGLKFDSVSVPVALTNSAMTNIEGVASISDANGNLLFYTNGITIYDSSHQQMLNGSGLLGDPSATQSGVIVKMPSSDSLYYIFTIDWGGGTDGLNYSIVDMSLNGGKGDVISKNNLIRANSREKVTAIRHGNRKDFWILCIDWASDSICSYLLDSTGINLTPVMSYANSLQMQQGTGGNNRANGYMKANRQGNRIAIALWAANSFDLFDFNNTTGVVSNQIKIQGTTSTMYKTYGVEFSPNGKILYGTTCENNPGSFKLLQFDLADSIGQNIFNSRDTLAYTTSTANNYYYTALQIAPDGRIYCSLDGQSFIGAINYPDSLGTACGYVNNAVSLNGKQCRSGLPNFLADYAFPIQPNAIQAIVEPVDIKIYPNPASDYFIVSIEKENQLKNATCYMNDVLGNMIFKTKIQQHISKIDVQHLCNGIYFVQVNINGICTSKKIVINK